MSITAAYGNYMHFAMTNIIPHTWGREGGAVGGGKSNNITFGNVFAYSMCDYFFDVYSRHEFIRCKKNILLRLWKKELAS